MPGRSRAARRRTVAATRSAERARRAGRGRGSAARRADGPAAAGDGLLRRRHGASRRRAGAAAGPALPALPGRQPGGPALVRAVRRDARTGRPGLGGARPVPEARPPWRRRLLRRPERTVAAGTARTPAPGAGCARVWRGRRWSWCSPSWAGWSGSSSPTWSRTSRTGRRSRRRCTRTPRPRPPLNPRTRRPWPSTATRTATGRRAPGAGVGQYVEAGFPHAVRLVTILITPGCSGMTAPSSAVPPVEDHPHLLRHRGPPDHAHGHAARPGGPADLQGPRLGRHQGPPHHRRQLRRDRRPPAGHRGSGVLRAPVTDSVNP